MAGAAAPSIAVIRCLFISRGGNRMKRVMTVVALLAICGLLFGINALGTAAGGGDKKDDKVHTVGQDGLKIDSKLTEDDVRHNYKVTLEGQDLDFDLRHKNYKVKLDGGKKYVMTVRAGDDEHDPLLVVLDSAGKIRVYDDDSGADDGKRLDSKLDFTPKDAGTFTIHVAGMRDTVGPYTLKIITAKGNGK